MDISRLAGDFVGKNNDLDRIVKLSQGLMCAGMTAATLLSNPTNLFKAVGFIAATAGNLIANAITDRISTHIRALTKNVIAPLKLISSYITSLQNILENFDSIYKKIKGKKQNLETFLFNTQNCAINASNFLNCISAVIAKKITKKVLVKIDTEFDKIQKEVEAAVFTSGGILEQRAGRHIREVERVTKQIDAML